MFGVFFFKRSKVVKAGRPSFRPRVDELETRLCPDGSSLSLAAQVSPGHLVQLTGSVTGGQVAGVAVVFSGAVSGTTQTDQNGAYSFTTNSASLGSVTAQITPMASGPVTATAVIDEPAPLVIMAISNNDDNSVTLTGTLSDIDSAGVTITLTGVAVGSVVTDSNGNFTVITTATAQGAINATANDLWGKTSGAAFVIAGAAPVITEFDASQQVGTLWHFDGTVTAADYNNMVITFGGLNGALNGETTTVNADGTFSVSFLLPRGVRGTVTAIATDCFGQESNEAWVLVG
jgi:hypothetical protein